MPWTFKDGTEWSGGTHELAGKTYSGQTRTRESRVVVWTEEKPKPASSSMPKPKAVKKVKPDAEG